MTGGDYRFRPVEPGNLALLAAWLDSPECRRWWGDPTEQLALLRADLDEPGMTMRIVEFAGRAFAYAQDHEVHLWPQAHLDHLPAGSRAIDAFIGEPALLGRGHGSAFLRLSAQHPRAGSAGRQPARSSSIGSDGVALRFHPDKTARFLRPEQFGRSRTCSWWAYAKAGFRGETSVETAEGRAVLMIFEDRANQMG